MSGSGITPGARIIAKKREQPYGYLKDTHRIRVALVDEARRLGWTELDQFHGFTGALLGRVSPALGQRSPIEVLRRYFPEYPWRPFSMAKTPQGYWKVLENRLTYLKWVESRLGITSPEGWYAVEIKHLYALGKDTVIDFYFPHPRLAAEVLYPNFEFKPWLFVRMQKGQGRDVYIGQCCLREAEAQLKVRKPEDWPEIPEGEYYEVPGLEKFIYEYGSLWKFLEAVRPEVPWREVLHGSGRWRKQQRLFKIIKALYHGETVRHEYWCTNLKFKASNRSPQIDVFVEGRRLGFEYQGGYHRRPKVQERDREKAALAKADGIQLMIIPEGWDGRESTLRELVRTQGLELPPLKGAIQVIRESKVPDHYQFQAKTYKKYVAEHAREPRIGKVVNGFDLGAWANAQRQYERNGLLSQERYEILDSVDFAFHLRPSWTERVEGLIAFYGVHGRWPLSKETWGDLPVGSWVQSVRNCAFSGKLDFALRERLDAAGFGWGRNAGFEHQLDRVERFIARFGRVPNENEVFESVDLGRWLWRTMYRLERLRCDKLARLLETLDRLDPG